MALEVQPISLVGIIVQAARATLAAVRVGTIEDLARGEEQVPDHEAVFPGQPRGIARTTRDRIVEHDDETAVEALNQSLYVPRVCLEQVGGTEAQGFLKGSPEGAVTGEIHALWAAWRAVKHE